MENPTHAITFYFGTTGEQKVFWDKSKLNPKVPISVLAREWQNDLGATRFTVETIG